MCFQEGSDKQKRPFANITQGKGNLAAFNCQEVRSESPTCSCGFVGLQELLGSFCLGSPRLPTHSRSWHYVQHVCPGLTLAAFCLRHANLGLWWRAGLNLEVQLLTLVSKPITLWGLLPSLHHTLPPVPSLLKRSPFSKDI